MVGCIYEIKVIFWNIAMGNTVQLNLLSYRNQSIDMYSKYVGLWLVYALFQPQST